MAHQLLDLLRGYLADYGYWAVALALLLENAGIPVPGETILLLASFHAYSEHRLRLPYIILVGIFAATTGDNIGFWMGYRGGRPLLERYQNVLRISRTTIERGERLFAEYGAATIFFARFIAGLRIAAGPLAGVLRMDWKKFALYNFLGATVWVSAIATVGYVFGRQWEVLVGVLKRLDIAAVIAAVLLIAYLWWRYRRAG